MKQKDKKASQESVADHFGRTEAIIVPIRKGPMKRAAANKWMWSVTEIQSLKAGKLVELSNDPFW
jgi:hypothetical protein